MGGEWAHSGRMVGISWAQRLKVETVEKTDRRVGQIERSYEDCLALTKSVMAS